MSEPGDVRSGGHPEKAGDDVRRSVLGTEFDDDPELAGAPDQQAEDADAGGQDSGSID